MFTISKNDQNTPFCSLVARAAFHVMYPSKEESAMTLFTFHVPWKRKDQNGIF